MSFSWVELLLAIIKIAIVLGFILGMPQIAAWIPGDSDVETKVVNVQKKLLPFQTIFGAIGVVAGLLLILTGAGILK